jgi:NAD(P)-dependent dehydrogenase (short-subunit alcohol dehydrogenase family)
MTTALVIGGYGGLGAVICEQLCEQDTTVIVAGRSEDKAADLAKRLTDRGGRATGMHVDLTCADSVERLLAQAWKEPAGLDILINCASRLATIPAEEFPAEEFRKIVETNLTGAFLLSREFGRKLIATGRPGRLVHLSSVRGAAGGRRGFAAYGPSKAGLDLLVRQLATEWGKHGITVNAVAPGFVRTEFVAQAAGDDAFVRMIRQRIPLGRFAEPEEVASAVLYLVSPSARFITGQILYVDGGVTASQ